MCDVRCSYSLATSPIKLCGDITAKSQVGSTNVFGPQIVPAALAALVALSFDVISVTEKLITHNNQELAFCGPNNMIL